MSEALPLFFVSAMGLSLLLYVILDGFDLGVGMLLPFGTDAEKDTMIASIGPFWDANETWIVMGVGVLLIAFPKAHGIILTALYIPVTIMLVGLILRGAAFDFRVKSADHRQPMWNKLFALGSLMASMAQGWMLGAYITGLTGDVISVAFSILISLTLPACSTLGRRSIQSMPIIASAQLMGIGRSPIASGSLNQRSAISALTSGVAIETSKSANDIGGSASRHQ